MKCSTCTFAYSVLALVCLAAIAFSAPRSAGEVGNQAENRNDSIERGRYLVMHVAMCVQCHSPRKEDGSLVEQRLLQGAPIPLDSPYRQRWAFAAPKIAGLPGGWTQESLATLLTTGRRPDGTQPSAPMPPYRLNPEDASAVADYLASLE